MASESFSQLSEPFQPVEGLTLYPNQWLNIDSLRFEDLLFGYFLGILDLRAVIDIESERSKRGQILDARELHLISIAEDPEAVGTYLEHDQAVTIRGSLEAVRHVEIHAMGLTFAVETHEASESLTKLQELGGCLVVEAAR